MTDTSGCSMIFGVPCNKDIHRYSFFALLYLCIDVIIYVSMYLHLYTSDCLSIYLSVCLSVDSIPFNPFQFKANANEI